MFELQFIQKLAVISVAGCFAGCINQKARFEFVLLYSITHAAILLLLTFAFSVKWNGDTRITVILTKLCLQFLGGVIVIGPWIISMCVAGCYTITIAQYAICKLLPNRPESKPVALRYLTTINVVGVVAIYLIMSFMFLFLFRPFW